jgi:hypothetical protein
MIKVQMKWSAIAMLTACAVLATAPAIAQKKYDPGASDTEIKIGQTVPFSGPASAHATISKVEAAYFRMINDQGGINGRKINLIAYDDAINPSKTVEQTLVNVLRACGDNLTRETVMDHLLNLKDVEFDLLLPGITISGSPTDYRSIKQLQMMRFNGERWEGFGPIITDDYSG